MPLVFSSCLATVTPPVCSCAECLSCVWWFLFFFLRKVTFGTWWKFLLVDWAVLYWKRLTSSFPRQLFTKLTSWSCVVRPCQELQAREPVQLPCCVSTQVDPLGKVLGAWLPFPAVTRNFFFLLKTVLVIVWHLFHWKKNIFFFNSSDLLGELASPKMGLWELAMSPWSPANVLVGDFSGLCETSGMSDCAVMAQASCGLPIYCNLDIALSNILLSAAVPGMQWARAGSAGFPPQSIRQELLAVNCTFPSGLPPWSGRVLFLSV